MKKLILIHGDDKDKIRSRVSAYKSQAYKKNLLTVELENLDDYGNQPGSLFDQDKIIFINATKIVKSDEIEKLAIFLKDYEDIAVLYLFKNAPKAFQSKLPRIAKEEKYELTWTMYKLFDSFLPGNFSVFYQNYLVTLQNNPPEMIFSMFSRQVRDLYWSLQERESMPYPDWRVNKLRFQAQKFNIKILKKLLIDLTRLDLKVKTSDENLIDAFPFIVVKYCV